jgi:hypothetical protein
MAHQMQRPTDSPEATFIALAGEEVHDQHIFAGQMIFSISYAPMTSAFGELMWPRTRSREATDGAGGSGCAPLPDCPAGECVLQRASGPGARWDGAPQLFTSSMCQRQVLSRCSRQRVPAGRARIVIRCALCDI